MESIKERFSSIYDNYVILVDEGADTKDVNDAFVTLSAKKTYDPSTGTTRLANINCLMVNGLDNPELKDKNDFILENGEKFIVINGTLKNGTGSLSDTMADLILDLQEDRDKVIYYKNVPFDSCSKHGWSIGIQNNESFNSHRVSEWDRVVRIYEARTLYAKDKKQVRK